MRWSAPGFSRASDCAGARPCDPSPLPQGSHHLASKNGRAPLWTVVVLAVSCGLAHPSAAAAQRTNPPDDPDLSLLVQELRRLESLSGGTLGVAAIHLESGREAYLNADEPFPMASTYKVPIAVQLLHRVEASSP